MGFFAEQIKIVTGRDRPPWFPAELIEIESSFHSVVSLAEKQIFKKKDSKQLHSDWVEQNVVVTSGPFEGSMINFNVTPYMRGILDATFHGSVQEITVCSAPQVAKTTFSYYFIACVAATAPGPVLVVYPDKDTARDNCRDRIKPMIEKSPTLAALMTEYDEDIASLRIKLQSMLIYMGWAGSATSLGNKSIRYLIMDEKDKYPTSPNKKEAAGKDLADKRTNAYPYNKKILNLSTPTVEGGPIWQDLTVHSEIIYDFWVKCNECGTMQVMIFGGADTKCGIKFPKTEHDPKLVEAKGLAWYQCEHCDSKWGNYQRDLAVAKGEWRSKSDGLELFKSLRKHNPKKIGFHIPSWLSSFIDLSKIAASFLRGVKDKIALKDFRNNHEAIPWMEYDKDVDGEIKKLMNLRDDRPSGRVPGLRQVATLVAGVDTQDNGFYYSIFGVGYGLTKETWLIRKGFVDSKAGLAEVLWGNEYTDFESNVYPVQFVVIDAMGHRTAEVYDFCKLYPGKILPSKGARTKDQAFTYGNLEFYPGSKKIIPGGLKLINVNTKYYKDMLDGKIDILAGDPGAYNLHSEVDEDYYNQMTSECLDDNGFWVQIHSRANHYWDCAVLGLVAGDVLGVKHWPKNGEAKVKRRRVRSKGIR